MIFNWPQKYIYCFSLHSFSISLPKQGLVCLRVRLPIFGSTQWGTVLWVCSLNLNSRVKLLSEDFFLNDSIGNIQVNNCAYALNQPNKISYTKIANSCCRYGVLLTIILYCEETILKTGKENPKTSICHWPYSLI